MECIGTLIRRGERWQRKLLYKSHLGTLLSSMCKYPSADRKRFQGACLGMEGVFAFKSCGAKGKTHALWISRFTSIFELTNSSKPFCNLEHFLITWFIKSSMRHCYCYEVCLAVLGKKEKAWGVEHTSTLDTVNNHMKRHGCRAYIDCPGKHI